MFIVAPLDKEFGFVALAQEGKIRSIDRNAESDEMGDSNSLAAHLQPHHRTKTESCQHERCTRKFRLEKVKRGADIALLATAAVVFAGAQPGTAKIESQHGNTKRIQRFCRLIDDFVVHRTAEKRMRMAYDCG